MFRKWLNSSAHHAKPHGEPKSLDEATCIFIGLCRSLLEADADSCGAFSNHCSAAEVIAGGFRTAVDIISEVAPCPGAATAVIGDAAQDYLDLDLVRPAVAYARHIGGHMGESGCSVEAAHEAITRAAHARSGEQIETVDEAVELASGVVVYAVQQVVAASGEDYAGWTWGKVLNAQLGACHRQALASMSEAV